MALLPASRHYGDDQCEHRAQWPVSAQEPRSRNQLKGDSMKIVCAIAVARTGTNHLFSLLTSLKRTKVRFEIFHWEAAFSLSPAEVAFLSDMASMPFSNARDPRLVSWIRANPAALLYALTQADVDDIDVIMFKLFPGHILNEAIVHGLAPRKDLEFLFIKRKVIDSYISHLKAAETKAYKMTDTRNIMVSASIDEFVKYVEKNRKWYAATQRIARAHDKRIVELLYETDVREDDAETLTCMLQKFQLLGIEVPQALSKPPAGLKRQDVVQEYDKKILNWPEFLSNLKSENLDRLAFGYF
jgi:hypothetical protein